jgi:signal transduction histidine kinase
MQETNTRAGERDFLLECLRAASRDDWSSALGCLCRAACTLASSPSAAVFVWPNGSPKCLASFQIDPPSVEELARRLGKPGRASTAQQVGRYQIFPLLRGGPADARFLLESGAPPEEAEQSITPILNVVTSIVHRKVRDGERQRARRDHLSIVQLSQREMEHRVARAIRARHDLKAPLVSMRGYLDMLLRGMAGPLSSQMQRYLHRIAQSVEKQRALIDSEVLAGPDGLSLVDIDHLVRMAMERAAVAATARGIGLTIDGWGQPIWTRANRSSLELLFHQLFRIAARRARSGSLIAVRLRRSADWLSVEVHSDLPWQPQVDEFRICQEIIRRHRGQLFVYEGREVVVEIRLPREPDIERWLQRNQGTIEG